MVASVKLDMVRGTVKSFLTSGGIPYRKRTDFRNLEDGAVNLLVLNADEPGDLVWLQLADVELGPNGVYTGVRQSAGGYHGQVWQCWREEPGKPFLVLLFGPVGDDDA